MRWDWQPERKSSMKSENVCCTCYWHFSFSWACFNRLSPKHTEIRPDFAKLWQVVLFLTAVVIPIYWFDKKYDVNYMFVNWPSAGSPLVWLADRMGNPGYLIGYAALVFLCMLLMDAGYLIVAGRRNQKLFF